MRLPPRRMLIVPILLIGSLFSGAAFAAWISQGLPSVQGLRSWRPAALTTLYAGDGSVLSRIGEQKRIVIDYSQIPRPFLDGIIATEDSNFHRHFGIDPTGIARALMSNLISRKWRSQGGSTITQQLARNLFLKPDKTFSRKIQEAVLALQIEREYTKEEILTFYSNQVYLGHGRYGVEAAAEYFFGRPARDLGLAECALLAGLVQSPSSLSPIRHPDRALRRRAHVLTRMAEEGVITPAEAERTKALPLGLSVNAEALVLGPYFVEEVRRHLLQRYGEEALDRGGLTVETTLDPSMQAVAERVLREGILEADRRRGFATRWKNVADRGALEAYRDPAWSAGGPEVGRIVPGLVLSASSTAATLRVGDYRATLGPPAIQWTGRKAPSGVMKAGDLVPLRVTARNERARSIEAEVPVWPAVEGALIAIESRTGEIKALVGGFDFARSEFDRAVQARRQAGSAFKPFLFSAALLAGMTPADVVFDEPTVLLDPQTRRPYQPENYYRSYDGLTTLRVALEESRNIVAVRLLDQVGYGPVIERARQMGITTPLDPYPSLALGAFEVSLIEMASAFSVFPNQGVRVGPHFIRTVRDRDGTILESASPEVREVMRPETAFLMTWLLRGVTLEGTATKALALGRPVAGKTGTTDDYSDAWFVGFSPSLTCGVWIGTDRKESLGRGVTGAVAALPPWIAFFDAVFEGTPEEDFERPSGVGFVPIDRRTGRRATAETGCNPADVILEAFVEGTEPADLCSPAEHYRISLPYFLHHFEVNEAQQVLGSVEDLADSILAGPPGLRLAPAATALEWTSGGSTRLIPLGLGADDLHRLRQILASPPPSDEVPGWFGRDGRRATVITIHRD